jgi:pimeloyl-ACP methyl ester carboxylesterase
MNSTRVFIHGLESSSQGTKGAFFREKYPDMIIGDFFGPFENRMDKLQNLILGKTDLILVGSSYGGLMAAIYTFNNERKVRKLILLAPALNLVEFNPYLKKKLHIPVTIYHGRHDDVVLPDPVHDIARMVFTDLQYHLVEDDHSLHETFKGMNWNRLLKDETLR